MQNLNTPAPGFLFLPSLFSQTHPTELWGSGDQTLFHSYMPHHSQQEQGADVALVLLHPHLHHAQLELFLDFLSPFHSRVHL